MSPFTDPEVADQLKVLNRQLEKCFPLLESVAQSLATIAKAFAPGPPVSARVVVESPKE